MLQQTCQICVDNILTAAPHSMKELEATEPLVKVHVDVVGPIDTVGYQGGRYFMTVVDEYSGYSVEGVFKDEVEIRVGLEECLAKWEVAARKKVVKSDRGGEVFRFDQENAAAGTSVQRAASQQIAQGGGGAQAAAVGSMGGEESGEGDSAEGEGGEHPGAANPAVPYSMQVTISNTEAAQWKEAMDTEMDAMKSNHTWELPLARGAKPL